MTLSVRSVHRDDRSMLLRWRNQPKVRAASMSDAEVSTADHEAWFAGLLSSSTDHMLLATVDGDARGVVSLGDIDTSNRSASWSCHAAPEVTVPGFGAALPIIGLGLGFGRFGLRRMNAEVLATNSNMRGIHRRLKMVPEGVRRSAIVRSDGTTIDVYEYGVLSTEWGELREAALGLLPRSLRSDLIGVLESLEAARPA